ncbi:polysaccharide deacetylase family protein [bacterium]|nr:polysaccharide deacetylase family protein [bacterium]
MASHLSLNEILGFSPEDKLLIVHADDVGMCCSANLATVDAMKNGLVTSGSIMVPCPWFPHIAKIYRDDPSLDFGIHLTHTCEWDNYRWGPVAERTLVRGLIDEEGFLWRDIMNVYKHSNLKEAEIEARAQIEKAISFGIDITHIDSHMGTLQYNLEYWEVYIKLAEEYDLPLRMGTPELEAKLGGAHLRPLLKEKGILFPDRLIIEERGRNESLKDYYTRILKNLQPGVTELFIHPALPTEELKNITGSWEARAMEYNLFRWDEDIKKIIEQEGIRLIGYRTIRDAQRSLRKLQS